MKNPSNGGRGRVEALDLLRLVAVLGVVLFHYGFRGPTAQGVTHIALPEISWFARYGFLGVPIFFVISGFVIAYSAEGRSASSFGIARFARIYPGFLFCMTLTFLVTLTLGTPQFSTGFSQWAANILIAAPALQQPYMDSAYWSLIYEIVFYGWIAIFIAAGLFRRRMDLVVLSWLAITALNELLLGSILVRKLFLTDASGFFATGLLIYEFYRGRRDARLQALLAASIFCAVAQAVHNLAWLRDNTGASFDDWIVGAICLLSILVILYATRIKNLVIPAGAIFAIGGITYPLYLLHQQIGYVAFNKLQSVARPAVLVFCILAGIAFLSWLIWRYVERPAQRAAKQRLNTAIANFKHKMAP